MPQSSEVLRVLQSRSATRAFYNRISSFYDLLSDRSETPMREAALRLLAAAEGERILEIGFGTGHCLVALARSVGPTGKVSGIDLSDSMVELARKNLAHEHLLARVDLICGDACSLPYPDNSLDAVLMCFTLELFDTPEIPTVLRQCLRVLRPGGRLVVASITKTQPRGWALQAYEWTHRHFPNLLDCRPIYVRRAVAESGFSIRRTIHMKKWIPVAIVLGTKRAQEDHVSPEPQERGKKGV